MDIFVMKGQEQIGPLRESEVRQQISDGTLSPDDLAWAKGRADWEDLRTFLRLETCPPPPSRYRPRRFVTPKKLLVLAVVVIAYMAWPYFTMWQLSNALKSGDVDALESLIDFPSVRESLKEQLRVQMTQRLAEDQEMKDNPFGGLATAFAPMMVNYAVDNFVNPTGMATLISKGGNAISEGKTSVPEGGQDQTEQDFKWSKLKYAFFTSPTRFLVNMDETKIRMGFTGFGWQVKRVEITMPPAPAVQINRTEAVDLNQ